MATLSLPTLPAASATLVTMLARLLYRTCRSADLRTGFKSNTKGPQGPFFFAKYSMLTFIDPDRRYTSRRYLQQWFDHKVIVTDNDLVDQSRLDFLLSTVPVAHRLTDITHNPCSEQSVGFDSDTVLTNNFQYWYRPVRPYVFFPIWLWCYSLRKNFVWHEDLFFDAGFAKTSGFMCLNNKPHWHRQHLYELLTAKLCVDQISYSINGQGLSDERLEMPMNDLGVGHQCYSTTAVNIVTETTVSLPYISEKTCKPFIAHQIPILVGCTGINKFLRDVGLDMFEDIVPWQQWDQDPNDHSRIEKIADFIKHWISTGSVLNDYQKVLHRVKRNKKYFHSEQFRHVIMQQMPTQE